MNQSSLKNFLLWHFSKAGKFNPTKKCFQLWQQDSHPIELGTNNKLSRSLHYIHQNPVEAGIVLSPEAYLYSSAANYTGAIDTLIDVILLEEGLVDSSLQACPTQMDMDPNYCSL